MFSIFKLTRISRVYEAAIETPLEKATALSKRMNNQIFFLKKDQQPVFSFKISS